MVVVESEAIFFSVPEGLFLADPSCTSGSSALGIGIVVGRGLMVAVGVMTGMEELVERVSVLNLGMVFSVSLLAEIPNRLVSFFTWVAFFERE